MISKGLSGSNKRTKKQMMMFDECLINDQWYTRVLQIWECGSHNSPF